VLPTVPARPARHQGPTTTQDVPGYTVLRPTIFRSTCGHNGHWSARRMPRVIHSAPEPAAASQPVPKVAACRWQLLRMRHACCHEHKLLACVVERTISLRWGRALGLQVQLVETMPEAVRLRSLAPNRRNVRGGRGWRASACSTLLCPASAHSCNLCALLPN